MLNNSDKLLQDVWKPNVWPLVWLGSFSTWVYDILNWKFWSIKFNNSNSINIFLISIESFLNTLDLEKINDLHDLSLLIGMVNDMFRYIETHKDEILLLEWKNLMNLKIDFRWIQKFVEKMCLDSVFIDKLIKSSPLADETVVINILKDFCDSFSEPYYYIIPHTNNTLPDNLKAVDIITNIRSLEFLRDDATFNSVIWKIRYMFAYILDSESNLLELSLEQLNKVNINLDLLVKELNSILDQRLIYWPKVLAIKRVINPSISRINNVRDVVEKNIFVKQKDISISNRKWLWNEIWEQQDINKIINLINLFPEIHSDRISQDIEFFWIFLDEFRKLSRYLLEQKEALDSLEDYEIIQVKKVIIDLFSKINLIMKKAKKNNCKQIVYNTSAMINWDLWKEFNVINELLL